MAPNLTSNPLEKHLSALTCYHYYVFVLIFIAKWPLVWHALSLIFLSPPMDFYCEGIDNKENFNKCPCDKPWFDQSVFEATMQTKFMLYCDRSWLIAFSHCICNTGVLVGSLTFGYLSDKYGRLTTFSASCLTIAISGSLVTVMPTITAFTCMRFFEGMGIGGSIVTSFVLCVEYSATVHREYITALFHLPLNLGHISMVGVSYLLRDFDNFQLAISLPIFLLVPLRWLMMESPKWLLDNAKLTALSTGLEKFNRQRSSTSIKEEFEQYLQTGTLNTTAKTDRCQWSRELDK
ncbi:solute carrier family 22 member 3-like isoform X2 [Hyposmocoma kahamanoa]|uniref:solute carrier family 22 member 3-like isoform X2 n=1 Tax=Hyposmocoma kahamanoa TaxID=1477025 RepID=UPI000E6D8FCC|nr:solute carrier family 22 member 3-like isoform X2 [Hyposmocoma kahamanoa]